MALRRIATASADEVVPVSGADVETLDLDGMQSIQAVGGIGVQWLVGERRVAVIDSSYAALFDDLRYAQLFVGDRLESTLGLS